MKIWAVVLALAAAPVAAQPVDKAALLSRLTPMAEAGNAEATYHLGMMKHLGIGGPKDDAAAFALFKVAAEAGDPLAAYKLGDYYAKADNGQVEPDMAEALRLKTIAAEAGYALAQHDVARLYYDAGNMDAALEWLTRSAQQGQPEALRALASLYNSDAIPKDGARTYAYFTLFLQRLPAPSQSQKDWIANFAGTLSPDDLARGDAIIRDWKAEPSPLTLKARSGLIAAEALVKSAAEAQKSAR